MDELYRWTDDNNYRHVFGVFLNITGAFDNVKWGQVLSRLDDLGASTRTIRIILSYLSQRTVSLTLENKQHTIALERVSARFAAWAYTLESCHV